MATSGSWETSWESGWWSQSGNKKYYHWSGNWSKSDNTITLSNMKLWMTFTWGSSGSGTDSVTVKKDGGYGTAQSVTFTASGTSSNIASLDNRAFDVGNTDTSATIVCDISGETPGSVGISFDATSAAPTITTLTLDSYTDTSATITIAGNYGDPSSVDGRWVEAGVAGQNDWVSPSLRSANATNVSQATITVDNNSDKTTTLTITPNTQYWYGGYIWNTVSGTKQMGGSFVTKASAATLTVQEVLEDSATVEYSIPADGGYYTKLLKYSIDGGGNWITVATVSSGSATTGTFTISGLSSGTTYVLQSYVTTSAGSTDNQSVQFTTEKVVRLYGSVDEKSKEVWSLYGSVNNKTARIMKVYGSVNGKTVLTYVKHIPYGIVYYTSSGTTRNIELQSIDEFNSLVSQTNSSYWSAKVGGGTATVTNTNIRGIKMGDEISTIPVGFLNYCTNLTIPVTIPKNVKTIRGGSFFGWTSYNQPFVIEGMPSIVFDAYNNGIFRNWNSMTSYIDIGSTPPPSNTNFDSLVLSTGKADADCYATGIQIKGANRTAWIQRFGDRSETPYRKLLDYGS